MHPLNYETRASNAKQPLAQKLLQLIDYKKSNLALSADVIKSQKLLEIADQLGAEICILKTHMDILEDFSLEVTQQLSAIAKQKNFLILEDRKFADIGNTVKYQYENGIYHIASWADFVTVHSLPGPSVIEGLKAGAGNQLRGAFLLAQMSSADNLLKETYVTQTLALAQQHTDFVTGFIAQQRLLEHPDFIYLTPGVNLSVSQDNLGQRYNTPWTAVYEQQSDVIIVGRAILNADNPLEAAREFRHLGWQAYESR
jgi:uridine monophosphate synthetase